METNNHNTYECLLATFLYNEQYLQRKINILQEIQNHPYQADRIPEHLYLYKNLKLNLPELSQFLLQNQIESFILL